LAFMRAALVACLALALTNGVIGTLLVLRRMSLDGDVLGHAVMPGAAIGFLYAGPSPAWLSLGGLASGFGVAALSRLITGERGVRVRHTKRCSWRSWCWPWWRASRRSALYWRWDRCCCRLRRRAAGGWVWQHRWRWRPASGWLHRLRDCCSPITVTCLPVRRLYWRRDCCLESRPPPPTPGDAWRL